MGVGPGTFAIIISCLIAIVICFFKDAVALPNLCVAGAIALPLLVLLIVRFLPV